MAQVAISNVAKAFGTVKVLHGVSVDIADGQFVVLVGPSGCGKSTLLRMVAGLETVSGGTIAIGDRVVNHLPPAKRDIAMVFQNYALYPHKTVEQNMAFALKLRKTDPADVAERVKRAADILDLNPYLKRYPRQLSGGQRQRVAMGRAIVRNPQVFLFDEPLSNLDAKLRVQMRTEIKELHQRLKTTTIYVTHDQIEAMTMADKIVVMRDGRIEQIGAPLELFDRPANLFVAGFIGSPSMNLLKGVVRKGDKPIVEIAGTPFPMAASSKVEDGRNVVYGVRPEHLEIHPDGVPAKISVVEPTGSETLVFLRFGEGEMVALFRERHDFKPGDTLHLKPRLDQVHLFDAETGNRL
ncbi:sn-glycerol-3-phosphate ABC transporter ATP-binding protein UgpC [Mesorhizobium sp.]|jgi:multiple sugar transport system ATP-binding protein|uniref:ABC transporter ATP-binding protein n=1 Tax=Mesorhizobium sp. TaxID=1871066 RepID=UPI000FE3857D|nr:sn-glycerol-3-phosphate ABC transporter ATP-binding protein UgpC [Mesorhizobium sp.]RWN53749.1 MAG: sn-glycerol-3-phosphate ABC transporter ATP-binding protein UgpC [Mesorhizobium sp.]RWN75410.1 MAG: sn-glycerol-3-phosphate ABC transporter ATP-binding protein UgpC [Mesorhizobium sp.]RWN77688.1 MAG: sn-glycerol-3-phosphate ABC transporter ATP-binding protein UgpC [Mesorhizobium sp.]RWN88878.1 MAG: sn-glycerol-3-phosphate ABC transporter ATP-binding protein UgpC [Mesorhizobium sp.]RWN99705.1 